MPIDALRALWHRHRSRSRSRSRSRGTRQVHRLAPDRLGAIFYGMFTPVAAFMRIIGRDAMRRRFEPASRTYWVERAPPGPDPKSLPDQF